MSEPIALEELDRMAEVMRLDGASLDGRWGEFAGRVLALPGWFDPTLDPEGEAYRAQQFRLWQEIAGSPAEYSALRDEQTPEVAAFDAIRSPGFYARRDPAALTSAADHLIALGHLVQRCGLRPGNTAIEYGAGFGQVALTLARLGVHVDAVDINPMFNDIVREQAEFYGVPLRAIHGGFGDNPRPGSQYDAVLFYEAFHHCPDPAALVLTLRSLVKPGGAVLLAGEPVVDGGDSVPYPWGLRLDAETVAVVRWRRWFELGFHEDYLVRLFIANGFLWTKHHCALTHYADVHEFRPRPERVEMAQYGIPQAERLGWHAAEPTGRWTVGQALLPIDAGGGHTHLRIALSNHHTQVMTCKLTCGAASASFKLDGTEHLVVTLPCSPGSRVVEIVTEAVQTSAVVDGRLLGIFVHWMEYVAPVDAEAGSDAGLLDLGRVELTKIVRLAGQAVTLIGDPTDSYFAEAASHAADLADLARRVAALPDGALILDVGANLGLSAITMAIAQPRARVIAFEPNPVTYGYLRRNIAGFANIEAVQAAASDRATVLHFHPALYAAGSHVVGSGHIRDDMPTVDVKAVSLDDFVAERGLEPSFIKLDVEGHEPEALAGAAAVIERFRPPVYMEFNSWTLNAFAGHSPAAFVRAIWDSFDVEGYLEPLMFLHENLTERGCVSNIVMRLKEAGRMPTLDMMSLPQSARDRLSRVAASLA